MIRLRMVVENYTFTMLYSKNSIWPFDQRAVIVLREIDEMSYDEIADSLGVAVGTVKSRLARAREQLRSALIGMRATGRVS